MGLENTKMRSKPTEMKEEMRKMSMSTIIGAMPGSVTAKTCRSRLAPSMYAAS